MRRGLAGLLLGVSLVVASLTWAGFVMTHTVLDPDRSERLADQVLDNEMLRSALITRLSDSLASTLPEGITIPGQQLERIAAVALDDPRVETLVRDGIVTTHQNALNGVDEPVTLNASALTDSARDALVSARPELDSMLPAGPAVEIELPTTGLTWLGRLRSTIERLVVFGFLASITGASIAFAIAKNRSAILRRVAFWAFGASAFWLAISYLVPFIAERVGPTSTAIAAAMTDVLFGAMVRPALMMAGFGGVLLVLSVLVAAANDRKPAKVLQPAKQAPQPAQTTHRAPSVAGQQSNVRQGVQRPRTAPTQTIPTQAAARPVSQADATSVIQQPTGPQAYPGTAAAERPAAQPPARSQPPVQPVQPTEPRWVEGIGYTDESPEST